ncbi:MAG: hypothetical protein CVT76_05720 [Alphaproteobacteria bacterium HGW-Alphaproteobacteria-15]|nr:MAG: hypothetical protein CVT76_05720 [Alphaproteobacteria bacterium HGW-Alphaproteobacteria-15]
MTPPPLRMFSEDSPPRPVCKPRRALDGWLYALQATIPRLARGGSGQPQWGGALLAHWGVGGARNIDIFLRPAFLQRAKIGSVRVGQNGRKPL